MRSGERVVNAAIGMATLGAAGVLWAMTLPPPSAVRLHAALNLQSRPWSLRGVGRIGATVRGIHRRRRQARLWRAAVIELCDGLAAELTAGRAPVVAFEAAATVLDPAVAKVLLRPLPGEEMPEMLIRVSAGSGAEGLRLLAGCWRIGAERGGAFAAVIDNLAAALRDQDAHRLEIGAQLAGPRATARLLAGLPLLGLAMAAALGAHPLAFLFGTLPGAACLVAGVGLDLLGLWWTGRLAAAVEMP
jgi:tight adherence protein B